MLSISPALNLPRANSATIAEVKQAYIFRGAPAVGKDTVVPKFAEKLGGKVALMGHDTFRWHFHLIGRKIEDITDEEHRFAFHNLLLMLEEYCKQDDYTIVIEGLFTWDDHESPNGNVQDILDILNRYNYECKCIVLKADKSVLAERNSAREYTVPDEEFDTLYNSIYNTIDPSEIVIDSTNQTPEQTLESMHLI